jgi:hypothetical protein
MKQLGPNRGKSLAPATNHQSKPFQLLWKSIAAVGPSVEVKDVFPSTMMCWDEDHKNSLSVTGESVYTGFGSRKAWTQQVDQIRVLVPRCKKLVQETCIT